MPTPVDFRWSSQGGILMDGTGDIADTSGTMDSVQDMVRSRLKAAIDGWKQYRIGAGLTRALGQANSNEVQLVLQRAASATLSNNFLSPGSFSITTLSLGDTCTIYAWIGNTLITSVAMSSTSNDLEVL